MALSQIQCLDDNNVNPRTHAAKPEFFYCENQRLALEVLLRDGREAFHGFLKARELRGFLSDPELETLTQAVEPYDPGSEVLYSSAAEDSGDDDDAPPLSLQYWPDLSDTSVPELDLGWPDSASYRGVTRTNVYTQPPLEGQVHIKEVVRKMIAQAQKVIAVVMDLFTDVDIFRDLLDAGYKRKVSVYILLDRSTLPHFLSMCDRANMHTGHLKNLRVRCAWGGQFLTRSSTRLRGRVGHRFMFVDGDKAVSGSYRYTWRSSRLDQHLITVVTGQAVDTFDRLFRELYATSSAVDLKQVAMEPEPESNPLPQPVVVAPSSEVARKLHNPMYALLGMSMNITATPAGPNSPADPNSQDKACAGTKGKRNRATKAPPVEGPPIHPGLVDLEKAYLIPYLPTWPEPDPSSDVIGFINVCDNSRKTQVHMQRSERFETSQAIRFSSPFNLPKEILPEVAQPRQLSANLQDMAAYTTHARAQEVAVHNAQPTSPNTGTPSALVALNKPVDTHILTSEPIIKAEKQRADSASEPSANTAAQCITAPHVDAPSSLSDKAPVVKPGSAGPPRPVNSSETTDTDENTHSKHVSGSEHIRASSPASSHASPTALHPQLAALPAHTQNRIAHKVSCKQDLGATPQSPSEEDLTPSRLISTLSGTISPSTFTPSHPASGRITSPPITTSSSVTSSPSRTTTTIPVVPLAGPGVSSPLPPFSIPSSSASNPSVHSHTTNTSALPGSAQPTFPLAPPVPKPRTVHLLIDSVSKCNVQNQPPDTTVVSEHGKWSGSGPVVDDYKPVKQLEDDIMTRIPTRPHAQSILTGNTLNDEQLKEIMPKESGNTYQARNTVRSHRVIEELGKPDKDSEIATKLHIQKATHHAQANELQQHSQTRTATASEPSFHAPENNKVIDAQHIAKPNQVTAGALSMTAHTQEGSRVATTTHPSNDEAVNNTRDRLHSAEGEARFDPRTPERKKQRHILELPAPQPDEAPAGRLSPSSPLVWRTPDGLCCSSPDARTPTPDTSDGYISSRDDSALSTTSDEYYECDESLRPSPIMDQGIVLDGRASDDRVRAPHAKRKGGEDEGGRGEHKARVKEDTAWATEGRQPSPAKTTKHQESVMCPSAEGPPDPPGAMDVDGQPPPASARKPADAHTPAPPALRRSSSSASSENTVSPFITPVPSPAPTPTTKRAASRPRPPPPDSEVGRPGGPGGSVEGKQVLRRDGRQEAGELIRKWEENLRRDRESERDQEFVTQGDHGTSPWELRSETSALRTSGAQMKKGPWVARETEVKKVLRSPPRSYQGRPKQQNHYSPLSPQSPAAKPARPGRPSSGLQAPRSYLQGSGKADQDSPHHPLQGNSALRQPPYRRHSSTHAAEQEGASEDFSRRSLHYAQPPASGQGSGYLPKPQPSFLYTYNSTHSQQHQAQPGAYVHDGAAGGQQSKYRRSSLAGDSEPGDAGQDLSKTGFSFSIAKLYSLKDLKNKGRGSPSPTKRNPDSPAQVRKSTG